MGTWSLSDLYTIAGHCRLPHGCHIKYFSDETHPSTHEEYLMKGPHCILLRLLVGGASPAGVYPHVGAPAFMRGGGAL
jgi:hypothetical protein